jgi:hypothetical protein
MRVHGACSAKGRPMHLAWLVKRGRVDRSVCSGRPEAACTKVQRPAGLVRRIQMVKLFLDDEIAGWRFRRNRWEN